MVAGGMDDALVVSAISTTTNPFVPPIAIPVGPHRRTVTVTTAVRSGAAAGILLATVATLGLGLSPSAVAVGLIAWSTVLALSGGFDTRAGLLDRSARTRGVLRTAAVLAIGCWLLDAFIGLPVTADRLALATATFGLLTAVGQEGAVRMHRAAGGRLHRVVLAGLVDQVRTALAEVSRDPGSRIEIAAVCLLDPGPIGPPPFDLPALIGLDRLVDAAHETEADGVLLLPHDNLDSRVVRRISWQLETSGIDLMVSTPLDDVDLSRTSVVTGGGLRLLHVRHARRHGTTAVIKGIAERIAAILAVVVLAPGLIAVALLVRRDSAGPALFRQLRVGRDGRLFTMVKFRTMIDNSDALLEGLAALNDGNGLLFKLHNDPRITRVGSTLRRYSIDELPQLLNVACGHMSLVGPRPALPREVAQYDPDLRRRLAVKPGLTGLWQVSGRSNLSWEESMRLDTQYVDNWSIGLDLRILVRTVRAVVRPTGAY